MSPSTKSPPSLVALAAQTVLDDVREAIATDPQAAAIFLAGFKAGKIAATEILTSTRNATTWAAGGYVFTNNGDGTVSVAPEQTP